MAKAPNGRVKRASLGVALMARNAADTLPRCLASIRPYVEQIVVGVDVTTTDDTAKAAKKAGADKVFPLVVSETHECPKHGKIMAQHFARARQATYGQLDDQIDGWMWLDADDTVSHAELLPQVVAKVMESPAVGAWFPYHYATLDGGKVTNTLFHRERISRVRLPNGERIDWHWEHRVHEVIVPKNVVKPNWLMLEEPAIYHQEGAHKTGSSAQRNLTLLEIDLEENPNDHRAMFYLGNQYFALGDWARAIYWYEALASVGSNHYELWQSWVYASIAYERLGNLDGATQAAFRAMDIEPRHPEPYLRMASVNLLSSEFDKCIWWTEQARKMEPPPFFVFKNPLDYSYNLRMPLADALAAKGQITEARTELEEAYKVIANERVAEAIERYKGIEHAKVVGDAFLNLTAKMDDAALIQTYQSLELPETVRHFNALRNRIVPAMIRRRSSSDPRLVIWCGRSLEEWSPKSPTTTGIGGSETAVIEIAQRFARDGWRVDVYNGAGTLEGEYDGVGYWDPERMDPNASCDVYVSWRHPEALYPGDCPKAILWLHDLHYGEGHADNIRTWDRTEGAIVCGVSQWHAADLSRRYGLQRAGYVPNGVDPSRFTTTRKVSFQCVYASSPDRGLDRLLSVWPRLLKREPSLTLHVGYGWDNIDKHIARNEQGARYAGKSDLSRLKADCLEMLKRIGPSVIWHGRMPQDELAHLYSESSAWLYPTDFLEVSCISAMEAMAGGCIPIVAKVGALPETIGDAGFLVDGMPNSTTWGDFYVNVAYGVLSHPNIAKPIEYRGRQRAQELTWDRAYAHWKAVIAGLGVPEKELVTA